MSDQPTYNIMPAGHQGSMQEMTNPMMLINNMELNLSRKRFSVSGKLEQYGKPLLNEQGVSDIRSVVESVVNQVAIMARLEKEEVKAIGMQTATTLIELLITNPGKYEIDSGNKNAIRSQIMAIAMNPVHVVLTRAREGDDKKFWKGTQNRNENISIDNNQQQFSWNPFRKRA